MFDLVNSNYFIFTILLFIVINTSLLSLDMYPESYITSEITAINSFFSVVFICEMVLKLIALGFKHYFEDPFNILDCVIVVTSLFDLV